MILMAVLIHLHAALLHGGHAPPDDWLQIVAPGLGFVALAVTGFAVYQYFKNKEQGLLNERTEG
jgi:hypothetical protein